MKNKNQYNHVYERQLRKTNIKFYTRFFTYILTILFMFSFIIPMYYGAFNTNKMQINLNVKNNIEEEIMEQAHSSEDLNSEYSSESLQSEDYFNTYSDEPMYSDYENEINHGEYGNDTHSPQIMSTTTPTIIKTGYYTQSDSKIKWKYNLNDYGQGKKEIEIIRGTSFPSGFDYDNKIVSIPSIINVDGINYSVTTLGVNLIAWHGTIQKLRLPLTIKKINASAFGWCYKLKNVYYDGKIADWIKIDFLNGESNPCCNKANFYLCDNSGKKDQLLKSLVLNESTIKKDAFFGCFSLINLELGNNVSLIDSMAFYFCENLNKVVFLGGYPRFGWKVFFNCAKLNNIYCNADLNTYCNYKNLAYDSHPCRNGANLYLNTKKVDSRALDQYTLITEINDVALTTINRFIFTGCISLSKVVINENITTLGENPFAGCINITEIIIHSTKYANGGDKTSIIDKASKTLITGTDNTAINENIEKIGYMAFAGSNIVDITIPSYISYMSDTTFLASYKLQNVILKANIENLPNYTFQECSALETVVLSDSIKNLKTNSFWGCQKLKNVTLPISLVTIGTGCFGACKELKTINIPESVTKIGYCAFENCDKLIEFNKGEDGKNHWPQNVTIIESAIFRWSDSIPNLLIPNGVTTINKGVFEGCAKLDEIVIPSSVTSIEERCFLNCYELSKFNCDKSGKNYWPQNVTTIENAMFVNARKLPNLDISCVDIIQAEAFKDCRSLITIDLCQNLTSIERFTFYHCYSLKNIILPNILKNIGEYAFEGCDLKKVFIFNNITSIGIRAFAWCKNLKKVEFEQECKITRLSESVFRGCGKLKQILIPSSIVSIDLAVLSLCNILENIIFESPNIMQISSVNKYAFQELPRTTKFYFVDSYAKVNAWSKSKQLSIGEITTQKYNHAIGLDIDGDNAIEDYYLCGTQRKLPASNQIEESGHRTQWKNGGNIFESGSIPQVSNIDTIPVLKAIKGDVLYSPTIKFTVRSGFTTSIYVIIVVNGVYNGMIYLPKEAGEYTYYLDKAFANGDKICFKFEAKNNISVNLNKLQNASIPTNKRFAINSFSNTQHNKIELTLSI